MFKIFSATILSLLLVTSVTPLAIKVMNDKTTKETINKVYKQDKIPKSQETLKNDSSLKLYDVEKTITLESKNTVTFRGPVTSKSVSDIMMKLRNKSMRLSSSTPLYLVLDTPGGSVFDGMSFIDFVKALPQKVHTITLFSASMGFHIAQNLDKRYITTTGTMMSHRARGGIRGQFDGEFETRYKMVKRAIDYLDYKASKRMDMDLKEYKKLIKDEYWVHGFDAESENVADEQVMVRCGKTLKGTELVKLRTFFGTINAQFSKCPLIKAPVSVRLDAKKENKKYLNYLYRISFLEKKKFIKEMIDDDKLGKNFPIK